MPHNKTGEMGLFLIMIGGKLQSNAFISNIVMFLFKICEVVKFSWAYQIRRVVGWF